MLPGMLTPSATPTPEPTPIAPPLTPPTGPVAVDRRRRRIGQTMVISSALIATLVVGVGIGRVRHRGERDDRPDRQRCR